MSKENFPVDGLNKVARTWAKTTRQKLLFELARLNIKDKQRLMRSLRSRVKLRFGQAEAVAFNFVAHGIYVAKGVGRGTSIDQAGTSASKRTPREWYNPVLDLEVEKLADILIELYGDEFLDNIKIQK